MRTKDYKLTFYYGLALDAEGAVDKPTQPGWELYDLQKDPGELKNVYEDPAYYEIREELKACVIEATLKFDTQKKSRKYQPTIIE